MRTHSPFECLYKFTCIITCTYMYWCTFPTEQYPNLHCLSMRGNCDNQLLGEHERAPHSCVQLRICLCVWCTYAHTAYRFAFQYNASNSFRNIPNCSRGHGVCSAASLGMLSQSRRQRQRLQRCRIYPQVGDKSHWNSRERVLEPEELSFLQATDSDTETREGA